MMGRVNNFPSFSKEKTAGEVSGSGITVYCFRKGGLPGERDKKLDIQSYGSTFTAEALCMEIAQSLSIASLTFQLFGLATPDLSIWLAANTKIECSRSRGAEYVFRIRVVPPQIKQLRVVDPEAFAYFYLQCRSDFVNECFVYRDSVKQERKLGQGLIDMLCHGREKELGLDKLSELKSKLFLPPSTKYVFKKITQKYRLQMNMKTQLEKEHSGSGDDSIDEIKMRYVNGFLDITQRYLSETFTISADDGDSIHTVLVNIYHDKRPGIYIVHNAQVS